MSAVASNTGTELRLANDGDAIAVQAWGQDSPAFLLSILDASPDCIKVIDRDGRLLFMNRNGQKAMEVDDFTKIEGAAWEALWPEENGGRIREAISEAFDGRSASFRAYCATAKGSPRWWDVTVSPVTSRNGEVLRLVSISRDVTDQVTAESELKKSEAELVSLTKRQAGLLTDLQKALDLKETVLNEVDHRIKNSLQMICSVLNMQARDLSDKTAKREIERAATRVQTIARVHERLYKDVVNDRSEVKLDEYLNALCTDLSDSVADGQRVSLTSVPATVSHDLATTFGLAIAELVTNAWQHGYAGQDGTVRVNHRVDISDGSHEFLITDDGVGLPKDMDINSMNSIGVKLMVSLLGAKGYTVEHENAITGATFRIFNSN